MSRRPPADLNIVAAFYERWAPHEDKRRQIADDHKEMFAEAKAKGLNPKALRKAFAEQYRVENQTNDQAEKRAANDTDFELYLTALARVREDAEEFDPETGEIKPAGNGASGAEEETQVATVRASSSGNSSTAALKEEPQVDRPVPEGPETASRVGDSPAGEMSGTGEGGTQRAAETPAGTQAPPVETHAPPAEGNTPTSAGHGDRGAVVPSAAPVVVSNVLHLRTHNPETHFLNSDGLPRLHGCLKADRCAGTWRALCFDCSRLHDGPTAQPGAA